MKILKNKIIQFYLFYTNLLILHYNKTKIDLILRHVVIGANTYVGTFVIRLLVTIGEDIQILAITPDGLLPIDFAIDQVIAAFSGLRELVGRKPVPR